MKRAWPIPAKILTGFFVAAMYALPQAYTISAKPGAVNYIEGSVLLNGQPLDGKKLRTAFLNPNETLATEAGKAEILLTPGVFLRLSDQSEIRMISPSLIDTQVELLRGEAMIEADQLIKDNRVSVVNHGASIVLAKNGLYRFTADDVPTAAVIEGKAQVYLGDKKIDLGKGHETVLSGLLKSEKFDSKKKDDLYAWSNVRSEYNASASYSSVQSYASGSYGAFGNGFGYGPYGSPYGSPLGAGWYWNNGFNSWAWLPGNSAFFSPFGYGFYGPGLIGYAPVIGVGGYAGRGNHGPWNGHRVVPVNPNHPPATGTVANSPWANHAARQHAAHAFANSGGFRTGNGAAAPSFNGFRGSPQNGAGWNGARPAGQPGATHPGWTGQHSGGGGFHGAAGAAGGGAGGGFHGGGTPAGGGSHAGGGASRGK
jgi:hypothetical protein